VNEVRSQRGRPRSFDSDAALNSAMQLFWRHGFEATSLAALLDAMSIGRSSFYQSFGSKQDVFVLALERYRAELVASLEASLEAAPSAWAFIRQTLLSVAVGARGREGRRGCLVFNTAAELGDVDAEISARVSASIEAFSAVFAEAARRAQREGALPPDSNPRLTGRQAVMAMSGLQTFAKAGVSQKELRQLALAAANGLRASPTADVGLQEDQRSKQSAQRPNSEA